MALSPASHFWELILGTVVALLPLINPLAATPTFLAITEGDTAERRNQQAKMGCIYMVAVLVSFLLAGGFIMNFFGISIPGLRIAGGLLIVGIGSGMLAHHASPKPDDPETAAARAKRDISFTPLAVPTLSGPGSIAVTLGFTSLATHPTDYVAIILGILFVAGVTYTALRLAGRIVRVIGVTGMAALTRIMGFLLLCVGIQFIVNGVLGIATDPELVRSIRDAVLAN
jgi:multiple antibiotic resistance protein